MQPFCPLGQMVLRSVPSLPTLTSALKERSSEDGCRRQSFSGLLLIGGVYHTGVLLFARALSQGHQGW